MLSYREFDEFKKIKKGEQAQQGDKAVERKSISMSDINTISQHEFKSAKTPEAMAEIRELLGIVLTPHVSPTDQDNGILSTLTKIVETEGGRIEEIKKQCSDNVKTIISYLGSMIDAKSLEKAQAIRGFGEGR